MNPVEGRIMGVLRAHCSDATARGLMRRAMRERGVAPGGLVIGEAAAVVDVVLRGARMFLEPGDLDRLRQQLERDEELRRPRTRRVFHRSIAGEREAIEARVEVRSLAMEFGAERLDALRLSTAVSELTRNAIAYAGGGELELELLPEPPTARVVVRDRGPGIADLVSVLDGSYVSRTGMGQGLRGTRELVDEFDVKTGPEGTEVRIVVRF